MYQFQRLNNEFTQVFKVLEDKLPQMFWLFKSSRPLSKFERE